MKSEKEEQYSFEDMGIGFAFPVHEKIKKMDPDERIKVSPDDKAGIGKLDLVEVAFKSLKDAWEQEIEPRIEKVRSKPPEHLKDGTDFFTEADTASEEVIRELFFKKFGKENLRIFGEEANKYLGNEKSRIGIRIDPIDGTESMKFGKPDWGIMVGIYEGVPKNERQIAGVVYYPERKMLAYSVENVGVFVTDLESSETKEIEQVEPQDDLGNMIIQIWEHSDIKQRGNIPEIKSALENKGARIRSSASSCADVLEALLTNGQRAMIIDSDYSEVDYIPYSFLEKVGYTLYDWEGNELRADDVKLKNKKIVVIPPGKTGKEILETIENK